MLVTARQSTSLASDGGLVEPVSMDIPRPDAFNFVRLRGEATYIEKEFFMARGRIQIYRVPTYNNPSTPFDFCLEFSRPLSDYRIREAARAFFTQEKAPSPEWIKHTVFTIEIYYFWMMDQAYREGHWLSTDAVAYPRLS